MIYKVITKAEFKKFITGLIKENQTIGPKAVDKDKDGKTIYQFREVSSFDDMDLDYTVINYSIKNFFLPFKEELSRFKYSDVDWEQKIEYRVNPRVIVGVRACDINALAKLGSDPFIVVNGDIWTDYDYEVLSTRSLDSCLAHLVLVDNPSHHSQGDFLLENNTVAVPMQQHGSPASAATLTFAGNSLMHPQLFANYRPGIRLALAPLLREAMAGQQVSGEHYAGQWVDVGTPERLCRVDSLARAVQKG